MIVCKLYAAIKNQDVIFQIYPPSFDPCIHLNWQNTNTLVFDFENTRLNLSANVYLLFFFFFFSFLFFSFFLISFFFLFHSNIENLWKVIGNRIWMVDDKEWLNLLGYVKTAAIVIAVVGIQFIWHWSNSRQISTLDSIGTQLPTSCSLQTNIRETIDLITFKEKLSMKWLLSEEWSIGLRTRSYPYDLSII